jgi:rare lipoprotein A
MVGAGCRVPALQNEEERIMGTVWRTVFGRAYAMAGGNLLAILCLIGLCAGCASAPLREHGSAASGERASGSGKAAYNRPYRVKGHEYYPLVSAQGYRERGLASWYGWESGRRTAMGTRFDPHRLTAAHRTLPLPTRVRVTNLRNGRSVEVLVNDRGPFRRGRLIDLSYGAARAIGIRGVAPVEVRYVGTSGTPEVSEAPSFRGLAVSSAADETDLR